jgi:hypothetical protein
MRVLPWCFALLSLLPQCGGAGPTTSGDAKSADDAQVNDDAASDTREPAEGAESESAEPENTATASCEDGTCSLCGSSLCPSGWYCDEKLSACSWLPACVEKPTCACVTRVLGSSCKCREEGGGLKVACD